MADPAIGATIQVVLETVISLAADRIGLFLGFSDELESLKESATTIQDLLADAEAKQGQNEQVKLWLNRLEGVAFEADNVFDELNYEILRRQVKSRNQQQQLKGKVCFFFSFSYAKFAFRWRMASKIRDVNTKLKKINQEAIEFGLSFRYQIEAALLVPSTAGATTSRQTDSVVVPNVVGRANDESKIVEMLLSPSDKVVSVIPIVGMGGMGKTTLAKTIYNNPKIDGHFVKKVWVCVAEKCEGVEIFRLFLESLIGDTFESSSKDAIIQKIRKELEENRYFAVLDDVWNQDQILWDDFFNTLKGLNATNGSWCLVTTRLEEVANTMSRHLKMNIGPYRLGYLPDEDCWSIVKEKVIAGEEVPKELEAIKEQILGRCGGLPLAATLIGSWLLMNRKEEWLSIVQKSLLDGDQNRVEQILKVSFDHLSPAPVKKCFAYCSIFSQDTELEKDQLIELWMAEGFFQPDPKNERLMEDTGDKYFRILLQSSLLLEEVNKWGITCYKMHDLVHDFAKSALNQDRYLALNSSQGMTEDFIKKYATSLRTLFLEGSIPGDILSNFECLHALILYEVKELPVSIGKLLHLRFLSISNTVIKTLPESLCKLYNLQTLSISNIMDEQFPERMSNLISMRHLHYYNDDAKFQMPSEMGRLTSLQTLKFFNVSREKGRGVEQLGTMKDLKGSLEIRNLELVNGREGAERAKLFEKPNLYRLKFLWNSDNCDEDVLEGLQPHRNLQELEIRNLNSDGDVLEGLQPHRNLQELEIRNFMGDQFSEWFINLSKLVRLEFKDCKRCKELPVLGQLPSLESLKLSGLENIRSIGLSFYGISDGSRDGQVVMSRKSFQALKYLYLVDMGNLEEWKDENDVRLTTGGAEVDLFPMLKTLSIHNCPQLNNAPSHFPCIETLDIPEYCHVSLAKKILNGISTLSSLELQGRMVDDEHIGCLSLEKRHRNGSGTCIESRLKAKGCGCLPNEILENLYHLPTLQHLKLVSFPNLTRLACGTSLQRLTLMNCENLRELPKNLCKFQALRDLKIIWCMGLTNLSIEMLESCTSLRRLKVYHCPNLVSFPLDLRQTPSLEKLNLSNCPKLKIADMPKGYTFLTSLRKLCIGPFSVSETTEFNWLELVSPPSTIRHLRLYGLPHIDSLPDQLRHLTSLTILQLRSFGIEILPDWIGNLSSLEKLDLWDCRKLLYLPSIAAMRRLSKLAYFGVRDCPLLMDRCNPQSEIDSEWSKISHIPELRIN